MPIDFSKYQDEDFLNLSDDMIKRSGDSFSSTEDLESLRKYLNEHPEITTVRITGTSFGDQLAELFQNANLDKLDLMNNKIKITGAKKLLDNPNITELNLKSNYISKEDALHYNGLYKHAQLGNHPNYILRKDFFSKPRSFSSLELDENKVIQFLKEIINNDLSPSIFSSTIIANSKRVFADEDTPTNTLNRVFNKVRDLIDDPESAVTENDKALFTALNEIKESHTSEFLDAIHRIFEKLTARRVGDEPVNLPKEVADILYSQDPEQKNLNNPSL